MDAVRGEHITFFYDSDGEEEAILRDISFSAARGEFLAILGANGSGKSTLVRHLNALLPLQTGSLRVWNLDVTKQAQLYELRRLCGMVFQNPDSQFVSSVVEEDIAFGMRNYDTPEERIPARVAEALRRVGMEGMERRDPHTLSGGQKQRAAIAGVLAMEPEILVFDEATAMLDPEGRQEVMGCLKQLHRTGKTVILITHYVEEALDADRILLMKHGRILRAGTPREILTDAVLLREAEMLAPVAVQLYYDLTAAGIPMEYCPLTAEELVEQLCRSK